MSNYFYLTLDTKPPELEVASNDFAIPNEELEIKIKSNKDLHPEYQDIYIVDNEDNKYYLVFDYHTDKYIGDFYTGNLEIFEPFIIYARLRDDVFNLSDFVTKTINTLQSRKLNISIKDKTRITNIKDMDRDILVIDFVQNLYLQEKDRTVLINEIIREIILRED